MGTLFLAWDPKLERLIAIKTLTHDDLDFRQRFAREARAAARLRHPHIVTIYDVGEHEGRPFIAMEYCPGETLEALLRAGTVLNLERKVSLLQQLCDGLAYAHRAGIVHRDIKPANLMVSPEGQLKVLDFGIARFERADGLTQAGSVIGTLNYMSPEQLQGRNVDHRSDIFSVGLVAYELISGHQAFPGQLSSGLAYRVLHDEPPPLAPTSQRSPLGELAGIVARAMAKAPADRYQDLTEMRRELLGIQGRRDAGAWDRTERMAVPEPTIVEAPISARDGELRWKPENERSKPILRLAKGLLLVTAAALALLALWRAVGSKGRVDVPAVIAPRAPAEGIEQAPAPSRPVPEPERSLPGARAGTESVDAPARPDPAVGPPAEPRAGRAEAGSSATLPPECARLLERLSLGESLSAAERQTLASKCRS